MKISPGWLKGTVSQEFQPSVFSLNCTPGSPDSWAKTVLHIDSNSRRYLTTKTVSTLCRICQICQIELFFVFVCVQKLCIMIIHLHRRTVHSMEDTVSGKCILVKGTVALLVYVLFHAFIHDTYKVWVQTKLNGR
jgi:hypothetical protein